MASIHPPRLHRPVLPASMGCSKDCHTPSSLPPSTVAAVRITAGPLINVHVAGPRPRCVFAFPEEGVYILYQRRTLQIAKARCAHRECSSLRCSQARGHSEWILLTPGDASEFSEDEDDEPCPQCLFRWLRLEEALSATEDFGLQAVQVTPSLSWALQSDKTVRMVHDADAGQDLSPAARCSKHLLSWMTKAWQDYLLARSRPFVPNFDIASDTSSDDLSGTTGYFWDMADLPSLDSFSDYSDDDSQAESFDDLSSDFPYIWSRGLQFVNDERNDKNLMGVEEPEHWDDSGEFEFIDVGSL